MLVRQTKILLVRRNRKKFLYQNKQPISNWVVLREEKEDDGGRSHLADAIDKVAEEESAGADEELVPPGAVRQRHAEEAPPLFLPRGTSSHGSVSQVRRS